MSLSSNPNPRESNTPRGQEEPLRASGQEPTGSLVEHPLHSTFPEQSLRAINYLNAKQCALCVEVLVTEVKALNSIGLEFIEEIGVDEENADLNEALYKNWAALHGTATLAAATYKIIVNNQERSPLDSAWDAVYPKVQELGERLLALTTDSIATARKVREFYSSRSSELSDNQIELLNKLSEVYHVEQAESVLELFAGSFVIRKDETQIASLPLQLAGILDPGRLALQYESNKELHVRAPAAAVNLVLRAAYLMVTETFKEAARHSLDLMTQEGWLEEFISTGQFQGSPLQQTIEDTLINPPPTKVRLSGSGVVTISIPLPESIVFSIKTELGNRLEFTQALQPILEEYQANLDVSIKPASGSHFTQQRHSSQLEAQLSFNSEVIAPQNSNFQNQLSQQSDRAFGYLGSLAELPSANQTIMLRHRLPSQPNRRFQFSFPGAAIATWASQKNWGTLLTSLDRVADIFPDIESVKIEDRSFAVARNPRTKEFLTYTLSDIQAQFDQGTFEAIHLCSGEPELPSGWLDLSNSLFDSNHLDTPHRQSIWLDSHFLMDASSVEQLARLNRYVHLQSVNLTEKVLEQTQSPRNHFLQQLNLSVAEIAREYSFKPHLKLNTVIDIAGRPLCAFQVHDESGTVLLWEGFFSEESSCFLTKPSNPALLEETANSLKYAGEQLSGSDQVSNDSIVEQLRDLNIVTADPSTLGLVKSVAQEEVDSRHLVAFLGDPRTLVSRSGSKTTIVRR